MQRFAMMVILFVMSGLASAQAMTEEQLQALANDIRAEHKLVGVGAVVAFETGEMLGPVVSGQRTKGGEPIEASDAWHIGSNTKMLTALIYGRLVEQGIVDWGATLPELFPELADDMHEDWQAVTIEDLLSHRSGLQANPNMTWFLTSRNDERSLPEQRRALAEHFLTQPASGEHGTFVYSNLGVMMAGAAIEAAVSRHEDAPVSYQEVFARVLLADLPPVEQAKWGFGPPPNIEGHSRVPFLGLMPQGTGPGADNPAALGPAGTVHVALKPHAELLRDVFLISKDSALTTHLTSLPDGTNYRLGLGASTSEILGQVFGHDGSNTMNLSHVSILPDQGIVFILNTNQADKGGNEGLRAFRRELIDALMTED
ncbi:MAG: hypothetical protein CMK09_09300 [Ponticaulis sp.]|nr:hypothetical protein [Ponticaulis sp.]|tara:strand:+ start:26095 stop:27207 length:1113 start_codon:yes stop_codon:yes gene_type:complete